MLPFLIFAALGIGSVVVSASLFFRARGFEARSITVSAEVASQMEVRNDHGILSWRGDLVWKDVAGKDHRYAVYSDSRATYPLGSRRTLRYDPAHPDDVRTDGGTDLVMMIFGTIGVVFLGILGKAVWATRGQPKTA